MSKIKEEILYNLKDITLIPSRVSNINSRKECFIKEALPLITAPMSSVVNDENFISFQKEGIIPIIPRSISFSRRLQLADKSYIAISLQEAEDLLRTSKTDKNLNILIDIANGHMTKLLSVGEKLKNHFKEKINLMGGNIANPETFALYHSAGFDSVRVGIAGGSQCLTGTQTGIHYPLASLISNTFEEKERLSSDTKIIADGGISSYSDAIKCLALGADLVMMGKVFAKSEEACGIVGLENGKRVREYYGMSTKRAQLEISGVANKTSEGKISLVPIEYTLNTWVKNFKDYLRSAMSYSDSKTLEEFKRKANISVISGLSSYDINGK